MRHPSKILIYHPGAIGDVMLATPVAATLKANFPAVPIIHCTHPSLFGLLRLCPFIDRVADAGKQLGVFRQRIALCQEGADLLIDLSGSSRSRLLTLFLAAVVLRYKKQSKQVSKIQHAVDNYLSTLSRLDLKLPPELFPTIFPPADLLGSINQQLAAGGAAGVPLVTLVPGVGRLRSHRAWPEEGWVGLIDKLAKAGKYFPALVGGADELLLCQKITAASGHKCINFAGKLSLPETAALLKLSCAVVSGDTGPAHLAVATGTPVIGLYGPTFPQRSGPYGCDSLLVDGSSGCRCHNLKSCRITQIPGPGQCMEQLTLPQVLNQLAQVLPDLG